MHRTHPSEFGLKAVTALVALLMVGLIAPTASALPSLPQNRYSIVVSPTPVTAGSSTTFSVTFKNQSLLGVLNSVDLTAPPVLAVTGVTSPRGTASASGNAVKLRHLLVLPGKSVTVTVSASAGCPENGTWSAVASGVLGIPFTLVTTGSSLSTVVSGECHLSFLQQPADAHPRATITNTAFNAPPGASPQVGVFSGNTQVTTGSTSVSLSIGANPGGAGTVLSGTTPRSTASGVAAFNDLSINNPGVDYTLVAAAAGMADATSANFTIADVVTVCTSDPCSTNLSDASAAAQVTAPAGTGEIAASFLADGLPGGIDCPAYQETTSTLDFTVTTATTLTTSNTQQQFTEATITFDTHNPHVSRGDYQVCFQSQLQFQGRSGSTVAAGTPGLLADCDIHHNPGLNDDIDRPPPCVLRRIVDGSRISLTFIVLPGDPKGRG